MLISATLIATLEQTAEVMLLIREQKSSSVGQAENRTRQFLKGWDLPGDRSNSAIPTFYAGRFLESLITNKCCSQDSRLISLLCYYITSRHKVDEIDFSLFPKETGMDPLPQTGAIV